MKIFLVNPKCCDNDPTHAKYNGLRFMNGTTVTMRNSQCTCDEKGGCVETCTDTCESLGYEYGTHIICGVSVTCPNKCSEEETCNAYGGCIERAPL